MTEQDLERQARLEQLQRRRGATTPAAPAAGGAPTPRKRHPAGGARIGAAGAGMAAMLGLVALMGWPQRSSGAEQPIVPLEPAAPSPQQVIVVIHPARPATAAASASASKVVADTVPGGPVALTARPVVRTIPSPRSSGGSSGGSGESSSSGATASAPAASPAPAPAPDTSTRASR